MVAYVKCPKGHRWDLDLYPVRSCPACDAPGVAEPAAPVTVSASDACEDCGAHMHAPLCGVCRFARLEATIATLTRERDEARAEVGRVRDLLATLEWSGSRGAAEDPCCPECGGLAPMPWTLRRDTGHAEGCALRAALDAPVQEKAEAGDGYFGPDGICG